MKKFLSYVMLVGIFVGLFLICGNTEEKSMAGGVPERIRALEEKIVTLEKKITTLETQVQEIIERPTFKVHSEEGKVTITTTASYVPVSVDILFTKTFVIPPVISTIPGPATAEVKVTKVTTTGATLRVVGGTPPGTFDGYWNAIGLVE